MQYREELILNVIVFVVRVWGGQYREELILNIIVFVVRVWGGQYRGELILNVTLFFVRVCGGQFRGELILNVTLFVVNMWQGNLETLWKKALNCFSDPRARQQIHFARHYPLIAYVILPKMYTLRHTFSHQSPCLISGGLLLSSQRRGSCSITQHSIFYPHSYKTALYVVFSRYFPFPYQYPYTNPTYSPFDRRPHYTISQFCTVFN